MDAGLDRHEAIVIGRGEELPDDGTVTPRARRCDPTG
jgi:hypothetical protein